MTDLVSRKQRSDNMRAVRGRDTTPEIRVRRIAHRLGYRFRLHRADLPGKPDIVFPRFGKVVFVHGCFWHQHRRCRKGSMPQSIPSCALFLRQFYNQSRAGWQNGYSRYSLLRNNAANRLPFSLSRRYSFGYPPKRNYPYPRVHIP